MQREIELSDARFRRVFLVFNLGWMLVAIVTLVLSAISAFSDHPQYLYEWRGLLIFVLMAIILISFGSNFLPSRIKISEIFKWPPPLKFSLPYWCSVYLSVTLLSSLANGFALTYFIVLGITFSLFERLRLIAIVAVIFLSYSLFIGDISWPISADQLGNLLGNFIAYCSLTLICFTIQHLISERYQRNHLLAQLAESHEALEAAHQKLAETAAQEQELAILRERTRLAREMHDTLGHALVLVSVKLEAAQRLREHDLQRSDQELESTKEIVRNSMKDLRASIADLRSPMLEREPASRALSRYAREMAQRTGLRITYDLHPDIESLPEAVEETLWKVGQEALTNIEKHAQAQNVLLHISRVDGQIFLKIADDGVGLPAELCQQRRGNRTTYESPAGHYGLDGIQERARNMQGVLSLRSNGERGTSIELTLPLVEVPAHVNP